MRRKRASKVAVNILEARVIRLRSWQHQMTEREVSGMKIVTTSLMTWTVHEESDENEEIGDIEDDV